MLWCVHSSCTHRCVRVCVCLCMWLHTEGRHPDPPATLLFFCSSRATQPLQSGGGTSFCGIIMFPVVCLVSLLSLHGKVRCLQSCTQPTPGCSGTPSCMCCTELGVGGSGSSLANAANQSACMLHLSALFSYGGDCSLCNLSLVFGTVAWYGVSGWCSWLLCDVERMRYMLGDMHRWLAARSWRHNTRMLSKCAVYMRKKHLHAACFYFGVRDARTLLMGVGELLMGLFGWVCGRGCLRCCWCCWRWWQW